eukprot:GHUV01052855.1.p1 GENE.GHUV01052855.1~~GHUV01052855.1.p1  ORF type:complete len:106 (+),score=15.98 GHUV01052855.1:81-398(+)
MRSSTRGTAMNTVGFSAAISSTNILTLPCQKPTAPPMAMKQSSASLQCDVQAAQTARGCHQGIPQHPLLQYLHPAPRAFKEHSNTWHLSASLQCKRAARGSMQTL